MKITIDTNEKTIQLDGEFDAVALQQFVSSLNLQGYVFKSVQNGVPATYPVYIHQPYQPTYPNPITQPYFDHLWRPWANYTTCDAPLTTMSVQVYPTGEFASDGTPMYKISNQ